MITKSSSQKKRHSRESNNRSPLKARTRDVLSREIGFIPNPCFREFDADKHWRRKLATSTYEVPQVRGSRLNLPAHLERMCSCPLLSREEEGDLFRNMNYLKYRANALRSTLNENRPSVRKLDEIELLLDKANEIRNRIVHANTRLVVSIVKKSADPLNPFDDLLSEGIACLMNVVEKFDYDRGFRFSTYATMAIRRDVFRSVTRSHRDRTRFATGATDLLDQQLDNESPEARTEAGLRKIDAGLGKILSRLDDREQFIIKARYGFIDVGTKPTYAKLGETLGISKERVRQLQLRAMNKLRESVDHLNLVELGAI